MWIYIAYFMFYVYTYMWIYISYSMILFACILPFHTVLHAPAVSLPDASHATTFSSPVAFGSATVLASRVCVCVCACVCVCVCVHIDTHTGTTFRTTNDMMCACLVCVFALSWFLEPMKGLGNFSFASPKWWCVCCLIFGVVHLVLP